jgi:signal transduction histidine kinase
MDQVEQALAGGLSELRLLVDSLDLVGETLADALATFLDRALQQTAAAGVRLEWSQTEDLAAKITDPKWTLNLYRLMQEAITNERCQVSGLKPQQFQPRRILDTRRL